MTNTTTRRVLAGFATVAASVLAYLGTQDDVIPRPLAFTLSALTVLALFAPGERGNSTRPRSVMTVGDDNEWKIKRVSTTADQVSEGNRNKFQGDELNHNPHPRRRWPWWL